MIQVVGGQVTVKVDGIAIFRDVVVIDQTAATDAKSTPKGHMFNPPLLGFRPCPTSSAANPVAGSRSKRGLKLQT